MSKERSLAENIIRNITITTTIVLMVVVIVLWLITCSIHKSSEETAVNSLLEQKINDMDLLLESSINKTDYIVKNLNIIDGLNTDFTDGYELLSFINDFKLFMDSVGTGTTTDREQILLYTENPSLIDGQYLRKMDSMPKEDRQLTETIDDNHVFCWNKNVKTDSIGNKYLSLYRKIPLKYNCFVEIKLYFEDILGTDLKENEYQILLNENWDGKDKKFVGKPLYEIFVLALDNQTQQLWEYYSMYLFLYLFGGSFFLLITHYLVAKAVKHTTTDIIEFIETFDKEENPLLIEPKSKWKELRLIEKRIISLNKKIYNMSKEQYRNRLLVKNMEIELMNMKINPHLLYNSLSAIKLLAFKSKNFEIEEITNLLIDYYRLMLNKGDNMISIGDELDYLEKYVLINEVSKKVKYDFDVNISAEAYDVEIPHMLLQPIVENAIYHGLNGNDNSYIGFDVSLKDDDLIIEISDNGNGITPEKLYEINHKKELGYGLTNVVSRLDWFYHDRYELKFYSEFGKGTKVQLKLSITK